MSSQKGFTLIEITTVLAILSITSYFLIGNYTNHFQKQTLSSTVNTIITTVNDARSRSQTANQGVSWGVKITQSDIITFKCDNQDCTSITDINTYKLPSSITITPPTTNPLIYQKITGRLFETNLNNPVSNTLQITVTQGTQTTNITIPNNGPAQT